MKKYALIYSGKSRLYEVHRYNWFFKLFPYTTFTWKLSSIDAQHAKERLEDEIYGEKEIIEIFSLSPKSTEQ